MAEEFEEFETIEDFNEERSLDELEEEFDNLEANLKTHQKVNKEYCGVLDSLKMGYAKVVLMTNVDMQTGDYDMVHSGFIFSSANYAAMCAINDENTVVVSNKAQFLSPVRVGDELIFEAMVRHKEGKRRSIKVKGYTSGVKILECEFSTVTLERHPLKLQLTEPPTKEVVEDEME